MPEYSCLKIEPRDFGRLAVGPTPNACRSPIMGSPDPEWAGARDGPGFLSHGRFSAFLSTSTFESPRGHDWCAAQWADCGSRRLARQCPVAGQVAWRLWGRAHAARPRSRFLSHRFVSRSNRSTAAQRGSGIVVTFEASIGK
jgi:hypothetical protein